MGDIQQDLKIKTFNQSICPSIRL